MKIVVAGYGLGHALRGRGVATLLSVLRGPARAIAHAGLRGINRFSPASLIERFAWLYDYDPVAAV